MKPENEQWIKDATELLSDMVYDAERITRDNSWNWFLSYSRAAKSILMKMPYRLIMKLPTSSRLSTLKLTQEDETNGLERPK